MPQILDRDVGAIGYGLMGLTIPNPKPMDQAFAAMRAALASGANFWNAGEFYGPREYNSLVLLEAYFTKYPEDASKVVLSVKGGLTLHWQPDLTPDALRGSVDNCIKQLNGKKKIDMWQPARQDHSVTIESWVNILKNEYVDTGKIGGIGLSEVNAQTIRKVAKLTNIAAVEVEVGLWSTEVFENGVATACAELSIPLACYSPLGRGMWTGQIKSLDDLPKDDMRRGYPRFSAENFPMNLKLMDAVNKLAKKKHATPAQIAIAWVVQQSHNKGAATFIPIPGASTEARAKENSQLIELDAADMKDISDLLSQLQIVGNRYPEVQSAHLNG